MTDTNNSEGIKIPEGSIALGQNAIISRYTIAKATQPAIDLTNPQEIIEKIKAVVENLGYSSLTFCGVDDFTGEHFDEENVCGYQIEGGKSKGFEHPYNLIQCHEKNKWMFKCANIYFRIFHNVIGQYYNTEDCYSNFKIYGIDRKFRIPRSNGKSSEGFIDNGQGIKIRHEISDPSFFPSEKNKDKPVKMYIQSSFNIDGKDICKDYLFGDATKISLIEKYKNVNPDMDKISIYFTIFDKNELDMATEVNATVMNYFNQLHKHWLNTVLVPVASNQCVSIDIYENGDKIV